MHIAASLTQGLGLQLPLISLHTPTVELPRVVLMSKRKASDLDPFKGFEHAGEFMTPDQGESKPRLPRPVPGSIPDRDACGLTEKYRSPNHPERPLRLLLVGHNPSDHAWSSGHYYSNPSNRMWKLLTSTGIVPPHFTCLNDDDCPERGIGFTDLGTGHPGTKSCGFSAAMLQSWRENFYERIQAHAQRAGAPPRIIAFTGKRQFKELLFDHPQHKGTRGDVQYGVQALRPVGWPFAQDEVVLFVLTSSSGASALRNEVREAPYKELSQLLQGLAGPSAAGQHLDASSLSITERQVETDRDNGREK